MSDDNNPINKALNLNASDISAYEKSADNIAMIVANAKNDSATEDFKFSRANVREVIETGTDAISKLALLADQSQNARAYEVLAKLMDTVVVASGQLLELQEKIKSIDGASVPKDEGARAVTNNLFVGSTAELQKVIANLRNTNA